MNFSHVSRLLIRCFSFFFYISYSNPTHREREKIHVRCLLPLVAAKMPSRSRPLIYSSNKITNLFVSMVIVLIHSFATLLPYCECYIWTPIPREPDAYTPIVIIISTVVDSIPYRYRCMLLFISSEETRRLACFVLMHVIHSPDDENDVIHKNETKISSAASARFSPSSRRKTRKRKKKLLNLCQHVI